MVEKGRMVPILKGGDTMEDIKTMAPEILRTAYEFGSEAYWALRAQGEMLPQDLLDRLVAIADKLILEEKKNVGQDRV